MCRQKIYPDHSIETPHPSGRRACDYPAWLLGDVDDPAQASLVRYLRTLCAIYRGGTRGSPSPQGVDRGGRAVSKGHVGVDPPFAGCFKPAPLALPGPPPPSRSPTAGFPPGLPAFLLRGGHCTACRTPLPWRPFAACEVRPETGRIRQIGHLEPNSLCEHGFIV